MIKQETVDVLYCDYCGNKADLPTYCDCCKKVACWNCRKDMVRYPHALYIQGSGDLDVCRECNIKLIERRDPKIEAYRQIGRLRAELDAWNKEFDERRKAAEAVVDGFLKKS